MPNDPDKARAVISDYHARWLNPPEEDEPEPSPEEDDPQICDKCGTSRCVGNH